MMMKIPLMIRDWTELNNCGLDSSRERQTERDMYREIEIERESQECAQVQKAMGKKCIRIYSCEFTTENQLNVDNVCR
jgi:hypothetical protein